MRCRGFGRVIGVDRGLVIPDERKTLRAGAVKPIQTPTYQECQDDLMRHAGEAGIPATRPGTSFSATQQDWVERHRTGRARLETPVVWHQALFEYPRKQGVQRCTSALLSKYRSYTTCGSCQGARLKTEAL